MPKDMDREVLAGFVEEAKSYLPTILRGVETFHREGADPDQLEEAHRLIHSIKGAASMVGLTALSHISYLVEEELEETAGGKQKMDRQRLRALTQALAQIEAYLDGVAAGRPLERPLVAEIVPLFRRLRGLPEKGDGEEIERLLAGAGEGAEAPGAEPGTAAPPPAATAPPEETSPELLEAFLDEAEDHLQTIGALLRQLGDEPGNREILQPLRRSVHTLKGAAAMVGFPAVGRLAHRAEDLLDRLFAGSIEVSEEILELLHTATDALEDLVEAEPGKDPKADAELRQRVEGLYGRFQELLGEEAGAFEAPPLPPLGEERIIDLAELRAAEGAGPAPPGAPRAGGPARPSQVVRVPIERLDDLVRLVSELVVSRSAFEQHFGTLGREVDELDLSMERLRRISGRLESEYEVAALAGGSRAVPLPVAAAGGGPVAFRKAEFDDLEMDRYTEFHLLSRELSETGSDIAAVNTELTTTLGDFDSVLSRLGRLTSEVQDKLMRLRMVPLASLAGRLHRTVRVTASQQGKAADLAIDGQNVALDKTVLEEIADPLLHLLRNAVDHGIEPSALRQVVGKPERGRVQLRAYHEGTQVVIQISDDGAGVEPQLVRTAAVSGEYLTEAEAAELSDEELYALLFVPGFTTAGEVSEVSGRGVGLDVVKATVQKLEGSVSVDSQPGTGTTFTIRLPMTLAITRVLLVSAGGQAFAVPLGAVTQILRLEPEEVFRVGGESVIRLNGSAYPLLRLAESLGLPQVQDETLLRVPVLVLNLGEKRYGLAVDRLVEAREVVVKPLGSYLRRVHGITGATLMGDGGVVLILNPGELFSALRAEEPGEQLESRIARRQAARPLSVMVVDDSLSVRRVISNLVRSAGWTPLAARDGVEALEMIQRSPRMPDVILLDIEMPRMDGYELTATLKGQAAYRQIPIVILTSRAGEKHRQKALQMGVEEYLVKPYQDEHLLNVVRRVTRGSHQVQAR